MREVIICEPVRALVNGEVVIITDAPWLVDDVAFEILRKEGKRMIVWDDGEALSEP